jgi:AMP-binding enzyme
MRPVPIGQVGCMWVGGIGVSAGYVNLPEKTAELWKPDPFAGKGRMMFNTRDLGRWRKDGQLDHLGRADDQVKINGFRVELDGVAAAMLVSSTVLIPLGGCTELLCLQTYEPVQSATAIVIGTELWGFVTPSTVDLSLVHNATAKVQPFYAVPRQYLAMDDFPITRNGKIDKRSLASLAASDSCEGVQRSAAWRLFASEIEQLHADTEDDKAGGDVLEVCKVSEFVSGVVHQVMGTTKIREDYDLFLQGCDRLFAFFTPSSHLPNVSVQSQGNLHPTGYSTRSQQQSNS